MPNDHNILLIPQVCLLIQIIAELNDSFSRSTLYPNRKFTVRSCEPSIKQSQPRELLYIHRVRLDVHYTGKLFHENLRHYIFRLPFLFMALVCASATGTNMILTSLIIIASTADLGFRRALSEVASAIKFEKKNIPANTTAAPSFISKKGLIICLVSSALITVIIIELDIRKYRHRFLWTHSEQCSTNFVYQ